MRKQKCLLDFRYYGDPALIAHVTGVRDGILSNPTKFADVPVTEAEMNLLITTGSRRGPNSWNTLAANSPAT